MVSSHAARWSVDSTADAPLISGHFNGEGGEPGHTLLAETGSAPQRVSSRSCVSTDPTGDRENGHEDSNGARRGRARGVVVAADAGARRGPVVRSDGPAADGPGQGTAELAHLLPELRRLAV